MSGTDQTDVVHEAVYLLEQAQDDFGEYDHSKVDDVLYMLREVADDE